MENRQEAAITGGQLKAMLMGAYQSFEKNYEMINSLNVFPVPDGDTGTNMMHTMTSVAEALNRMNDGDIGEVGQIAARSAVFGARGNSGVILSQLLYGISKGLAGKSGPRPITK
jgi:dihydroxyacetone kinase-like predicted kinase